MKMGMAEDDRFAFVSDRHESAKPLARILLESMRGTIPRNDSVADKE